MTEHVLGRRLTGSALARMLEESASQAGRLGWGTLIAPFVELPGFGRRVG